MKTLVLEECEIISLPVWVHSTYERLQGLLHAQRLRKGARKPMSLPPLVGLRLRHIYIYIYSYIIYPYIQYSIYIHFRRHQSVQKLVALPRFEFEYALSPFPMVTLAVAQIWPCWHKMAKGGSEYPESTHK